MFRRGAPSIPNLSQSNVSERRAKYFLPLAIQCFGEACQVFPTSCGPMFRRGTSCDPMFRGGKDDGVSLVLLFSLLVHVFYLVKFLKHLFQVSMSYSTSLHPSWAQYFRSRTTRSALPMHSFRPVLPVTAMARSPRRGNSSPVRSRSQRGRNSIGTHAKAPGGIPRDRDGQRDRRSHDGHG